MNGEERSVLVSSSAHREPRLSAGVPKARGEGLARPGPPSVPEGTLTPAALALGCKKAGGT